MNRVAVAAAFAAAALLPVAAGAVESVPFSDVAGGLVGVQASIDGKPPVPMLVDLGAGVDVLSARVANGTVFNETSHYTRLRMTGERLDLRMGTVVSIALGDFRLDDLRVGVWKGLDGTGTDGLISAAAFRNVATTFDFRNRQIVFEDQQSFAERRRLGSYVPLVLQDDRAIGLGLFAWFDFGGGRKGLCQIDTGSNDITISKNFAAELGGSVASIALVDAPKFSMSAPQFKTADLIYDCDVGNQFWSNRSFTIDIPNRALYVSTPA